MTLDIVMVNDVFNMDEVIVTAIGVPRETKALSYSVQNLYNDICKAGQNDMINSLQGKVADVAVISSSGTAGQPPISRFVGLPHLTGNNQPLFIIDGVPIAGAETGGSISFCHQCKLRWSRIIPTVQLTLTLTILNPSVF